MKRIKAGAFIGTVLLVLCGAAGCGGSGDPVPGPGPDRLPKGAWYRGDLHCHSTHSDGDSSVAEVIAEAERRGLDYFVITDHDGNMGGVPTQWQSTIS